MLLKTFGWSFAVTALGLVVALFYGGWTGFGIGSFGDGKFSGAIRADLAAAAAVVLTNDDRAGKIYELGGTALTMSDLAAEVSRQTGNPITYQDMPVDQYAKALTGAGLPAAFAELLADTSLAATRGDWYTDSTDLPQLIVRHSTPWPPPSPTPSRPAPPTTPSTRAADLTQAGCRLSRSVAPRPAAERHRGQVKCSLANCGVLAAPP
ncbi:hypothetical protein [Streptomyces purpurascens]|uniref:Uncharacterized protein n=1 Tax=Streptomyces purpurascens TaxID=1924 RepID=A0ABZ1MZK3_STREF